MKRVLVLDNSHVGSLRAGYQNIVASNLDLQSLPEIIFAATTGSQGIEYDGKRVFVRDDHPRHQEFARTCGSSAVDLDEMDTIILVGGPTPLNARHYLTSSDIDIPPVPSPELICDVCSNIINRTFNAARPLYKNLVYNSEKDVVWLPNPCEPQLLNHYLLNGYLIGRGLQRIPGLQVQASYLPALDAKSPHSHKRFPKLSASIRDAFLQISRSIGLFGAILPPANLLSDDGFRTLAIYSKGSQNFYDEQMIHPDMDPHMNGDYGGELMSYILSHSLSA